MTTLAESYDALLLDLDGTIYLGGQPIDHVAPALARAKQQGARSVFVTNNASRPPAEVAGALAGMGVPAEPEDVLTSPQAAAVMLTDRHPAGTKVLVVGAPWLVESVREAGLEPVRLASEGPAAVVQGHSPDTGWRELAEACIALRAGADWVACNIDSTLPTDRGLLPGNGAMVAALVAATGLKPRVAGKPESPLLDAAVRLVGSERPLVVGDRLDTDIACAVAGNTPSLLVFTGVSTAADLLAAAPEQRPTYLSFDLRGLVEEDRSVRIPTTSSSGSGLEWSVTSDSDALLLSGNQAADGGVSDASALRALAMLTARAWATGITRARSNGAAAAAALERCGLTSAPAN
ncbi:HAD-IIA family hydrolase [Nakamurella sp. GG22]